MSATTKILCLGNSLLADDGLGPAVAERLRGLQLPDVEVVETAESGFYLLDHILNCARLVVVDAISSRSAPPGTIHCLREEDARGAPGGSPHYVGLFEVLETARRMHLPAPDNVQVLAVEVEDLLTIGGAMTPAVRAAVPAVVGRVRQALALPISAPALA
jgi:hydrogenase maturation protease